MDHDHQSQGSVFKTRQDLSGVFSGLPGFVGWDLEGTWQDPLGLGLGPGNSLPAEMPWNVGWFGQLVPSSEMAPG